MAAWPWRARRRVVSSEDAADLPCLRRESLPPRHMPPPRFALAEHARLLDGRHGTWHQGHWRDFAARGQVVERPSARSLFALRDACVAREGLVFDARREYRLDYFRGAPPTRGRVDRREVILTLCWRASDYYNLLLDMLPLLLFSRDAIAAYGERLSILWFYDGALRHVRDALAWLDLDASRFVDPRAGAADAYAAELVLLPFAHPRDSRLVRYADPVAWYSLPQDLAAVRELGRAAAGVPRERRRVVYTSRRDVAQPGGGAHRGAGGGGRAVSNEADLVAWLRARYGDDLVVFVGADHDLCATAALFSQARIVLGPQGGALANTVFSAPGTILVEFLPALEPTQFHYYTTAGLDQRYWPLPIADRKHHDDLCVPLAELAAVLDAAEADVDRA
jgi:capsular polysaccharide biosynthesis protein